MWWEPMSGWWVFPFFGIIFMVLMLLIVSRWFGRDGFCSRPPSDREEGIEELRKEIKALRDEIRDLKNK